MSKCSKHEEVIEQILDFVAGEQEPMPEDIFNQITDAKTLEKLIREALQFFREDLVDRINSLEDCSGDCCWRD